MPALRASALPATLLLTLLLTAGLHVAWLVWRWGPPEQAAWYINLPYLLVIALSAALAGLAWRRSAAPQRGGLRLLTLALLALTLGEGVWVAAELLTATVPPISVADLLYGAYYVLLGLALLRLARVSLRPLETAGLLLDSAIIVGVVGIYAWYGFLGELATDTSTPLSQRLVALAYPTLDLGLLTLVLLAVRGRDVRFPVLLLAAGLATYAAADLTYALHSSRGHYESGQWLDALWTLGTAAQALAGWWLRRAPLQETGAPPPAGLRRLLRALPYLAVALSCGLLLLTFGTSTPAARGVAWGTVALFALVMCRQAVSFVENARLNQELRTFAQKLEASRNLLSHQAFHDALTGLPNRALFRDRLEQALTTATRYRQRVAVLYLDLDGFKLVNDTLGHAAGDELLVQAAGRMRGCLRESDTLARMGGDEFTVILTHLGQPEDAELVAGRLVGALAQPFELAGEGGQDSGLAVVTASIGLSVYDGHAPTEQTGPPPNASALQRRADLAMYQAKTQGKNSYRVFHPDMEATVHAQERLESALRGALDRGEFTLHYQPQVRGSAVTGVEALLRWTHHDLGEVPPDQFIPVAEDSAVILPLGAWVMDQAAAQAARWQAAGTPLRVAVNVSPREFAQSDFVERVQGTLTRHHLRGEWLELEVTERLVVRDIEAAAHKIRQLRRLGVLVSLDDFGAGHSALSSLMKLPISALKIDHEFVENAEFHEGGQQLIQAITSVARAMNLAVVAEGVETERQLNMVRALGCDQVQGFLFARPMPADDLTRWLAEWRAGGGQAGG
ncbi:EAL domain-containing protein [Deinococcus sp. HMF7604]|uniref:putative bifunctional diguanylate cyclase/phosphodiesterase n=1 Tax=Deinococcus betulae TaxID=2873312 RepID=UPI001CCB5B26|nr:EAL domain-containing protein [Deinococcus betulae]MBZ9749287.1 EAL domain-containing protein [Deinococcus betulae]